VSVPADLRLAVQQSVTSEGPDVAYVIEIDDGLLRVRAGHLPEASGASS